MLPHNSDESVDITDRNSEESNSSSSEKDDKIRLRARLKEQQQLANNHCRTKLESIAALGLRCQQHNTIALLATKTLPDKTLYWLPYIHNVSNRSSIFKQINSLVRECFQASLASKTSFLKMPSKGFLQKLQLLSWVKVAPFTPTLASFEQRIYIAEMLPKFCYCEHKNSDIKWIPLSFNENDNDNEELEDVFILGVEVDRVIEAFQSDVPFKSTYEEVTDVEITYVLDVEPYREHLKRLNYNRMKVFKLYQDFQNMSYPSLTLCESSFKEYFNHVMPKGEFDLGKLFQTFSHINGKYLTFSELLLGLSLIEPEAGMSALRAAYIFNYYSSGNEIRTKTLMKLLPNSEDRNKQKTLTFIEFQNWFKTLRNEDTNRIFKAQKSPIAVICGKEFFPKATTFNRIQEHFNFMESNINSCCLSMDNHKLIPYWMCHETRLLNKICDNRCAFGSIQIQNDIHAGTLLSDMKKIAHQIVDEMRLFCDETGEKKEKFSRNERFYNVVTVQNMLKIFENVKKMFLSESALLKISPPCLVFGDIHGNLADLLYFEKYFWPLSPTVHPFKTLFLGDYVDRGELSLEVVLYLFSMKILLPNKIFMLRGNHELRHVQISYTFEKECLTKLGKAEGKLIWEAVNKVFDVLPLAAVIGGRLFCSHGGIPVPDMSLENIAQIDKVLFSDHKTDKIGRPESQSPIGWQLLWNDPFEDERYFREYLGTCMWSTDVDFIPNIARGTAMYFLPNSVREFVQNNRLSYVVRAHECPFFGTRLQFENRLCTVFSCSNYCGKNNFSGMLLVEKPETVFCDMKGCNFRVGMIHRFSIDRPQIEPDWLKVAKAFENDQDE